MMDVPKVLIVARDISVTSNVTCLKIDPNNNIFIVYIPHSQILCNLKEQTEIYLK